MMQNDVYRLQHMANDEIATILRKYNVSHPINKSNRDREYSLRNISDIEKNPKRQQGNVDRHSSCTR